jgi:hypothetical protein
MTHQLRFATAYNYDPAKTGIELPLKLSFSGVEIRLDAKVDTGASHCIFERQQGERLGLDIERGLAQRFETAMGGFPTYGHEVRLNVLGVETTATVYFAAEEHFNRNVLGRTGWLDRVRFGLIDHDSRLYLSAYDDPA